MRLSIIIPVLLDNRVFSTIHLLGDYLNQNSVEHEFIVSGILSKADHLPSNVKFIPANGQKGSNLFEGFSACKGETVIFVDADLPATCENILKLVLKANSCDVVLGSRILDTSNNLKRIPFLRKLRTTLFKSYISLLFPRLRNYDTQYGLKLFKAKVLHELLKSNASYHGLAFDLELCIKISQSNFSVFHMKVPYAHVGNSVIEPIISTFELVFHALCIRFSDLMVSDIRNQHVAKQLSIIFWK
jgi:glycosyltransferase involved in cell wall biosynthesis